LLKLAQCTWPGVRGSPKQSIPRVHTAKLLYPRRRPTIYEFCKKLSSRSRLETESFGDESPYLIIVRPRCAIPKYVAKEWSNLLRADVVFIQKSIRQYQRHGRNCTFRNRRTVRKVINTILFSVKKTSPRCENPRAAFDGLLIGGLPSFVANTRII
jgi:hypothetical protein